MLFPKIYRSPDPAGGTAVAAPVATPAAPSSTAAAATGTTPAPSWTDGFSDDQKGYVGNKGYKSAADLVDSYRGLEKLMGGPKDRLLALPERFYDDTGKLTPEGRAVRERLGAPKESKDYNLLSPKEGGDPKLLEHFRGLFHELGLPKSDAEKITGSWNAYAEAQSVAAKEVAAASFKDQQTQLAKEWGAATEQNTNLAKEAVRAMGIKESQINALSAALGHVEAMKFLHKLGTQVREAPFIGGGKPDALLEPVNAKAQIKELINDKNFGKLLSSGDRDAQAKWQRLHEMAHPGELRN